MGPAMTYPNRAESSRRVDTKGRSVDSCGGRRGTRRGWPHPRADESRVVKPPTHRPIRPTALPDDPNLPHVRLAWSGLESRDHVEGEAEDRGGSTATKRHPLVSQRHTFTTRPAPPIPVTLLPLGNPRHREPRAVRACEQVSRVRNTPRLFSTLKFLYEVERGKTGIWWTIIRATIRFEENIFQTFSNVCTF